MTIYLEDRLRLEKEAREAPKTLGKLLTKAKFRNFVITETKLPRLNLMTEEQLQKQLAFVESRLENAKKFFKAQKAELIEKDAIIADLTAKLEQQASVSNTNKTDIAESIYNAYPRKVNKKSAIQSINKAIIDMKRDGGDGDCLLKTVERYRQEVDRHGLNPSHEKWKSIPHPTTWFNQARYEQDEAEWSSLFRDGKYVKADKPKEVANEPPHWEKVMKHLYPTSDPSRHLWPHFSVNHPDVAKEITDKHDMIAKELGL